MTNQQKKDLDIGSFSERINNLSPERRRLLEAFLKKEEPEMQSQQINYAPPSNEVETLLAEIWAAVFRLPRVGIKDNFFELGGDSIFSIQIMAKAQQAGIALTSKQLFDYPTISELSKVVSRTEKGEAANKTLEYSLPLTPAQLRFFESNAAEPNRQGYTLLLEADPKCKPPLLAEAIGHARSLHDALRLRFERKQGEWRQIIEQNNLPAMLPVINISELSAPQQRFAIEDATLRLWEGIEISEGLLAQAAFFDFGPDASPNLLIIAHRLIANEYSISVILDEVENAYKQLAEGKPVTLSKEVTSYKEWAESVTNISRLDEPREALAKKFAQSFDSPVNLPLDFPSGSFSEASITSIATSLTAEETQEMILNCPQAYHCRISELLIAPLVQTLCEWANVASLTINLELEARELADEGSDLARAVGLINTEFPMRFDLPDDRTPAAILKRVKDQLRQVPNRGINYELARYSSPVAGTSVNNPQLLSAAPVRFAYLGAANRKLSLFRPVKEIRKFATCAHTSRPRIIEAEADALDGQLKVEWKFSSNLHRPETIENIANNYMALLRSFIETRQAAGMAAMLPSDFPEADLSIDDLEKLIARRLS